jgi:hypothetical protein
VGCRVAARSVGKEPRLHQACCRALAKKNLDAPRENKLRADYPTRRFSADSLPRFAVTS